MAYPIVGTTMNVTCAVASDIGSMFGSTNTTGCVRIRSFTLNQSQEPQDVTGADTGGVVAQANIGGLYEATAEVVGFYPKIVTAATATTPRLGNSSLLTLATTATFFCKAYTLEFDWGEEDITSYGASAVLAKVWMPSGIFKGRGTFVAKHSSAVNLSSVTAANSAGEAATFKLTEDGTDPAFTGNIIITGCPFSVDVGGGQVEATYSFITTGPFTAVAGSTLPALLPAGTVDQSDWDLTTGDGIPDVTVAFTAATGRTYTAPCFQRGMRLESAVGTVLKITSMLRVAGAMS